jgi:hypothetical protein
MAIGITPQVEKVVDGKYAFDLWLRFGTLAKVGDQLIKDGIISPRTGRPVTRAAISMSVWRWCIRNPDESFQTIVAYRKAHGITVTRDSWDGELIKHARSALTPTGYINFLRKNQLEEKARLVR